MPKKRPTPDTAAPLREPETDLERLAVEAYRRESDLAAAGDAASKDYQRLHAECQEEHARFRAASQRYEAAKERLSAAMRRAEAAAARADHATTHLDALVRVFGHELFGVEEPVGVPCRGVEELLPADIRNAMAAQEEPATVR